MRLSCKALKNVDSVNAFRYADQWVQRQFGEVGDATTLYFQIVDLDRRDKYQNPLRYIPSGSPLTITVTFPNLDDTYVVQKSASQPFAQDASIWKVDLTVSDLPSSGAVRFALTAGAAMSQWFVPNMMQIDQTECGGTFHKAIPDSDGDFDGD